MENDLEWLNSLSENELNNLFPDKCNQGQTMKVNVDFTDEQARDITINQDDVDDFINSKKKANTTKATKRDVSNIERWLRETKFELRPLELIDPPELNSYLSCFFISVRKSDGTEYEPSSLTSMLYSCEHYLSERNYGYSVIKDASFQKTHMALKAKRIDLKQQGKGNKLLAAKPITDKDEDILYEKGVIGSDTPFSVTFSLWYSFTVCMGMRGRDEHRKLRFGDITLTTDNCGKEYLVMKERDAKTRDGGDVNDNRDTKAKVMCVCNTRGKKCCPVEHFKTFAVHRPASRNHDTDPFYLGLKTGINYEEQPVWFTVAPMGVNKLGSLLPQACEKQTTAHARHALRD